MTTGPISYYRDFLFVETVLAIVLSAIVAACFLFLGIARIEWSDFCFKAAALFALWSFGWSCVVLLPEEIKVKSLL